MGTWVKIFLLCILASTAGDAAETWNFERVVQLIQQKDIRSIEALLPVLPIDLRKRYALMRRSGSLQSATDSRPRVILYGDDASLLLAFGAGNKEQDASLEIIQYRRANRSFELREITFEKDLTLPPARVSLANPPKCLACHGEDPRPNWEAYLEWPGAYGSFADQAPGVAVTENG